MSYDPVAGLYVAGEPFGVAPAQPPPPSRERLRYSIRFEHARKRLAVTEFAGPLSDEAEAALHQTDEATLRAIRADLRARARAAEPTLALDLPPATIVALGDSITDDSLSWAEMLRGPLERAGHTLVNAGLSGDTTADLLRRLYGIVALRPALVITLIGTNDVQRHGAGTKPLVGASESAANLRAIRGWLGAAGARTVWITPPAVDEAALARAVAPRPLQWRNADLQRIAAVMRHFGDTVIDGAAAVGEELLPDGVHPSEAGQARLAAAVAGALSRSGVDPSMRRRER